jgi:hypothetical protein
MNVIQNQLTDSDGIQVVLVNMPVSDQGNILQVQGRACLEATFSASDARASYVAWFFIHSCASLTYFQMYQFLKKPLAEGGALGSLPEGRNTNSSQIVERPQTRNRGPGDANRLLGRTN